MGIIYKGPSHVVRKEKEEITESQSKISGGGNCSHSSSFLFLLNICGVCIPT